MLKSTIISLVTLSSLITSVAASDTCLEATSQTLKANFSEAEVVQCENACLVMGFSKSNPSEELVLLHDLDESSKISFYGLDHFYTNVEKTGNFAKGVNFQKVSFNADAGELLVRTKNGHNFFLGKQSKETVISLKNNQLSVQRWLGGDLKLNEKLNCQ